MMLMSEQKPVTLKEREKEGKKGGKDKKNNFKIKEKKNEM